MRKMQAFIDKARTDSALMAKLDTLGTGEEVSEKVIAIAAEYGFAITEEDYRQAAEQVGKLKSGELAEEDLEAAAGGGPTQNRYDPERCSDLTQAAYECVGFLKLTWCDHFRETEIKKWHFRYACAMGCFDYIGDIDGKPHRHYEV